MLSKDGIHESTVDVWETSKEHNMASARFVNWVLKLHELYERKMEIQKSV